MLPVSLFLHNVLCLQIKAWYEFLNQVVLFGSSLYGYSLKLAQHGSVGERGFTHLLPQHYGCVILSQLHTRA